MARGVWEVHTLGLVVTDSHCVMLTPGLSSSLFLRQALMRDHPDGLVGGGVGAVLGTDGGTGRIWLKGMCDSKMLLSISHGQM